MSNETKQLFPWLEISQEEYDDSGRLDVNIKLHVKVKPQDPNYIVAYGINRKAIVQAELPSDFEYMMEEFIRTKLTESNLHVEKMVIV